jgi:hypothetical protein
VPKSDHQLLILREAHDLAGLGIEFVQARPSKPDPKVAFIVFHDAMDLVRAQGSRIAGVVRIARERIGRAMVPVNPTVFSRSRQPQNAMPVFVDIDNALNAEATRITLQPAVQHEFFGSRIEAREASISGADPQVSEAIFMQRFGGIMAYRGGIGRVVFKDFEALAIVPRQPLRCAKPEKAATVLPNAPNPVARQAVLDREVFEWHAVRQSYGAGREMCMIVLSMKSWRQK